MRINADVCMGIRKWETDHIHILSADASGFWGFLASKLISYGMESVSKGKLTDLSELPLPRLPLDNRPGFREKWGGYNCQKLAF